jgi:hypothetical protein
MQTPPTLSKPIRCTVPVSPEVHAAFEKLAKASGMSVGRAMGDWLGDTIDAVAFMADTMAKARATPKLVARELHSYALGLTDETGELIERMREQGRVERSGAARPALRPPSSNTGGKGTKSTTRSSPGGRS